MISRRRNPLARRYSTAAATISGWVVAPEEAGLATTRFGFRAISASLPALAPYPAPRISDSRSAASRASAAIAAGSFP
jgi:hypothetical protein